MNKNDDAKLVLVPLHLVLPPQRHWEIRQEVLDMAF